MSTDENIPAVQSVFSPAQDWYFKSQEIEREREIKIIEQALLDADYERFSKTMTREKWEHRETIIKALLQAQTVLGAARLLGKGRTTVQGLMELYEIGYSEWRKGCRRLQDRTYFHSPTPSNIIQL